MYLSINFKNQEKNQNCYPNPYSKNKLYFFCFKLSYTKFARNSQNTQTQTQKSNTQKI